MATLIDTAREYLDAGLCVLPAIKAQKRPATDWKRFQSERPTLEQIDRIKWADGLCLICGKVSGNLELIDFDQQGEWFDPWKAAVEDHAQGLVDRLVIESSQRGGVHVVYRCESEICGNVKLASRRNAENKIETMIETRGEGGLFLCWPTPGYELIQGDFNAVPVITAEQREILLSAAWSLNEDHQRYEPARHSDSSSVRPGDDFNSHGDVEALLVRAGWSKVKDGANQYWRRPGKNHGWSATLKDRVFYCHTSSAHPFEPQKAYAPFSVYALLEHGGDFSAAASALRKQMTPSSTHKQANSTQKEPDSTHSDEPDWFAPLPVRTMMQKHQQLREPIIHGLLRRGESMNVISAPKVGKSWLVLDLALSIVTGGIWLSSFQCERGHVLVLDNELHPETTADRVPKVAQARSIPTDAYADRLHVLNMRGRLLDINACAAKMRELKATKYDVVIFDAFYRFMPVGTDENDNGAMTNVYNMLDRLALDIGCCLVLVHHSSKGVQGNKSVTDVGSGAGAQSRATDTHLVLRQHEQDGVIVLDAATRSWPPIEAACYRWVFPAWHLAPQFDPKDLKTDRPRKRGKKDQSEVVMSDDSVRDVVISALQSGPLSREVLMTRLNRLGNGNGRMVFLMAQDMGLIAQNRKGNQRLWELNVD